MPLPTKSAPLIQFQEVSFSYGEAPLLEKVSFEVKKGEFIGVIGPNGGGKTTALKLMLGSLRPQSGKIAIVNAPPPARKQQIGYVPQINDYDKQFPISALQVVLTGALSQLSRWGRFPKSVKMRALELLDQMGLAGLEKRAFGSLSGGQAQKALIARALINDPPILLLDEPTANVDPKSEEAIFAHLKALEGKKTLLIVTHNFDALLSNASRILCFQKGVASLLPSEVCHHFTMGMYHKVKEKRDG